MNPRILLLAVGVAVGYVLGARAGRERYDAMKAKATELWEDPRVTKARRDVEAYARQQAPIIRERAGAAAKDLAEKVSTTAKDVAEKTASTAKDVAEKTATTAKDVAERVTEVAADVRDQAGKVAADLRERGENAVTSAVATAGEARDKLLETVEDDDPRG